MGDFEERLLKFLSLRKKRINLELRVAKSREDKKRIRHRLQEIINLEQRMKHCLFRGNTFSNIMKNEEVILKRLERDAFYERVNRKKR